MYQYTIVQATQKRLMKTSTCSDGTLKNYFVNNALCLLLVRNNCFARAWEAVGRVAVLGV